MPLNGKINGNRDTIPIKGSNLKQAINRGAELLGHGALEALIAELERQGIDLSDESSNYTLERLEAALDSIFGEAATDLLMEKIRQALKDYR